MKPPAPHDHPHDHHHNHHHPPHDFGRAFAIGITLNLAFVVVEVIYGLYADSLALLADAGHNFGDVMGLVMAWGATRLARWQPTSKHTYGFRRSTVLAALLNSLFLLVAIGAITWEAIRRFHAPTPTHAPTIIAVAAVGIAINTATALLFMAGRKADLNVRGAFLHMVADAAISAGVVAAGYLISLTGIQMIDPIVSILIAVTIFVGTWHLLRESFALAMDAVPAHIDACAVANYLAGLPTVREVHHLHIWGLSTTDVALTVHLTVAQPDMTNELLARIQGDLHRLFGIEHATLQFESTDSKICLTKQCTLHFSHAKGSHDADRK